MDLIEQIEDRLSIFKGLYDSLRIVDPVNKKIIMFKDQHDTPLMGICYGFWGKNTFCENCISIRAFLNNDTFVKIEYKLDKVFLITATPVNLNNSIYVVELLKDISQNYQTVNENGFKLDGAEKLIAEMSSIIVKDELTGVYNRRYINERLSVDIKNSENTGQPLSVIMTDIDYFKNVNDNYGHLIGDKILTDFAKLLEGAVRKSTDWVARYGGEEFIIVLNNMDSLGAYEVAEKIRHLLEQKTFVYENHKIQISSSFGISSFANTKQDIETLISAADIKLYEAKKSGRNRTVV